MKIGIITMHKVHNNGSALQAFALQTVIESLGYKAEIIDYDFNADKKQRVKPLKNRIVSWLIQLLLGFPRKRRDKKFVDFHKKYFHLSKHAYNSRNSLVEDTPIYDVYCTGSDQVWNPRFISDDTSFMLSFAPDAKPKIAYAASFATDSIPENLKQLYTQNLSKYDKICVREYSNVKLIKDLTQKESVVVCDPTLLLSANEWERILHLSPTKRNKTPYILVYILSYMYNPYPYIYDIINTVKATLGCQVVYLGGKTKDSFEIGSKCIKDEGPLDFIDLFRNASFVITDSFHGTAFSTIFGVPMLGVVKSKNSSDGRLQTLLQEVGGVESIIEYNDNISFTRKELLSKIADQSKLSNYREKSKLELVKMIKCYAL